VLAGILNNADLIAGVLGVLGSTVLAWPMVGELRDRRHWDRVGAFFRKRTTPGEADRGVAAPEEARRLRDQMIDERLGDAGRHRFISFFGFVLLLLAFLLLVVAALNRV